MAGHACSNGESLKGLATPTRNKYFYGKLMDAFHFELEQFYGVRKRSVLNRLALGRGVLCGLQVAPTADGKQVMVGRGVCLDALGREIIVPEQTRAIDPRQVTDDCGQPEGERLVEENVVHICLAYHECDAEPVPVLVGDCDSQAGCAASVVRERYRILVRKGPAPEIKPDCGFQNVFAPPPSGAAAPLYPELVKRISQPCEDPEGSCVVLAQIELPDDNDRITPAMINPVVRPLVYSNELLFELLLCLSKQTAPGPAPQLTNITQLSWDHDQTLTLNKFMRGLKVGFSGSPTPTTIHGEAWFIVTVEYPVGRIDTGRPAFMPGTIFVQHVLAERVDVTGNTAFFKPDEAFKETFVNMVEMLRLDDPPLCRVVLKCNALKDGNDQAIDGDFLLGTLPSGDGMAGGDFESWFTLSVR
jgi:hypothetical protein